MKRRRLNFLTGVSIEKRLCIYLYLKTVRELIQGVYAVVICACYFTRGIDRRGNLVGTGKHLIHVCIYFARYIGQLYYFDGYRAASD